MVYKVPGDVVKPYLGWFGSWTASDCSKEVHKVLDEKESYISCSFYTRVPIKNPNLIKYKFTESNFDRFLNSFCNPKELQEYRFQALECDYGDLHVQDSYLIAAVTNQYSADAYCLLQKKDLKFSFSLYDPDLIRRINTQEKYDTMVEMVSDGEFTCQEANELAGCTICD